MIRWWWVHGSVDVAEIRNEVDQISSAGFGGVEIQDVHNSDLPESIDPEGHGWATTPWIDAALAALDETSKKGIKHDFGPSPAWPLGTPSVVPDDDAAAKEIAWGKYFVRDGETYSGAVPAAYVEAAEGVTREDLFALQAWRVNNASNIDSPLLIVDFDSLIDLSREEENGQITWTPPDSATWLLLSTWVRGSAQQPEGNPHTVPTTYVVDHFSSAGVEVVADFWDANILSDEFRRMLKETPGAFLEDSIEVELTSYWTLDFPSEFRTRQGYEIASVLPAILRDDEENVFAFDDSDITRGALNDYYDTLSDLYIEGHVKPFKLWAESLGMEYRAQAYGIPGLDGMKMIRELDIPEGESLGFKVLDNYRAIAGAAGMSGRNIISNEAAAYEEGAYMTTWAKVLGTLNPQFAAGINLNVLHGFSYITAPGAIWPGFAAFTPMEGKIGYSESWGPRQPAWSHAPDITAYLGRVQLFLRQGVPKHDCALFRQNGAVDSNWVTPFFTSVGAESGWSANYIDPALLELPTAFVENNRFAPDAANYAMIAVQGDVSANSAPVLSADTAERLLEYAQDGLPMLWIGDWSSSHAYGYGSRSDSDLVKSTVDKILELPNVVNVVAEADIADGVEALGIEPAVQHDSSNLIHLHREDGELDHFIFVANSTTSGVSKSVSIPRRSDNAVPVMLDPWTGDSSILPLYQEIGKDRLSIPLTLNPSQTALITLVPMSDPLFRYAVDTTAQTVVRDSTGERLLARATAAGSYITSLDNGKIYNTSIGSVLPVIDITSWALDVDDWQPANGNGTTGDVTATKFVKHNLNLTSLAAWDSVSELEDVSGNGTYSTTFVLGSKLDPFTDDMGAYLQLTQFNGSFRAKVNGESLPPLDQLSLEFDIGDFLKNGTNTIEIEVATSLLNRMRVVSPSAYGDVPRQSFGLLGVTIQPYRQAYMN